MNYTFEEYIRNAPITCTLFALNAVIFLANKFGLIPPVISVPGSLELYTFFAHFSHIDLLHFGFNMLILLQISPMIERKIPGIFYAFIIIAMWMLLVYGGHLFSTHRALGFSGIGLGLITFCGLLYRNYPQFSQQILGWAVLNVFIGLLPGISFLMHFLGFVFGGLLFGVYLLFPYEKQ